MKLQDFLNDLCYKIYVSQKMCSCGEILSKQISDRITRKNEERRSVFQHDDILEHYSHAEGWKVEGFNERQWLYIKCLRCHVSWSLDKLGVPQSTTEPISSRTTH